MLTALALALSSLAAALVDPPTLIPIPDKVRAKIAGDGVQLRCGYDGPKSGVAMMDCGRFDALELELKIPARNWDVVRKVNETLAKAKAAGADARKTLAEVERLEKELDPGLVEVRFSTSPAPELPAELELAARDRFGRFWRVSLGGSAETNPGGYRSVTGAEGRRHTDSLNVYEWVDAKARRGRMDVEDMRRQFKLPKGRD